MAIGIFVAAAVGAVLVAIIVAAVIYHKGSVGRAYERGRADKGAEDSRKSSAWLRTCFGLEEGQDLWPVLLEAKRACSELSGPGVRAFIFGGVDRVGSLTMDPDRALVMIFEGSVAQVRDLRVHLAGAGLSQKSLDALGQTGRQEGRGFLS